MNNDVKNLSRDIEQYILDQFDDRQSQPPDGDDNNSISLRRKEHAEMFGCVPSQINYVLRSRFGPERGYLIESRRGEYGYIKILRITYDDPQEKSNHLSDLIGDAISVADACRLLEALRYRDLITDRERLLIEIAIKHDSSPRSGRSRSSTARLLKKMLSSLVHLEIEE